MKKDRNKKKIIRIVFSFDDGRCDNYNVALEILKEMNIPATFNITTAYVDGSISMSQRPCMVESMKVKDVVDLEKQGFEIAGHGDCHQNSFRDIEEGLQKLRRWLNYSQQRKIGFASPNSQLSEEYFFEKRESFEKLGVAYVRVGIKDRNNIYDKLMRKLAYLTKSSYFYKEGFKNSLEEISNSFVLHSIPVMNKASVNQVKRIVKEAVNQKKDCILMFHSIVSNDNPFSCDDWSWDRKKFEELCEWVTELSKQNVVELVKTEDLFA